jgi:type II secretory ATPase GspE/PulE/Tfp pilus assembly ATPase PilB-like protein
VAQNEEYILEILLETALVTKSQLDRARSEKERDETIVECLIRQGAMGQEDVTRALAAHASMDFVDLNGLAIPEEVVQQVPKEVAKRFKIVPVAELDTGLMIAVSDPLDFDTFDALHALLKRDLEFVCATPEAIQTAYRKYFATADEAAEELEGSLGHVSITGEASSGTAEGDTVDAPIIKMVTMMLIEAYNMRASDIHLEPLEKRFRVRFRVDGVLAEMNNPPKKLQSAIISRLKIMSGTMSIAEKRLRRTAVSR